MFIIGGSEGVSFKTRTHSTLSLCNNVSVFPHVFQINFVNKQFKESKKEWVLLVCIGASSGVGRLAFGKIGDLIPGLQKIYMQVRKCMNGLHGETAQPHS